MSAIRRLANAALGKPSKAQKPGLLSTKQHVDEDAHTEYSSNSSKGEQIDSPRGHRSCTVCDEYFADGEALESHYKNCSGKPTPTSSGNGSNSRDVIDESHIESGPKEVTQVPEALEARKPRNEEPYCETCDVYFSSQATLYHHRVDVHPDSPLLGICPVCSVICFVSKHLTRAALHRYSQNCPVQRLVISKTLWPRPCFECNTKLYSPQEEKKHYSIVNRHNRIMHASQAASAVDEYQRLCWPCDRYFASESELKEHLAECTSRLKYLTRIEGEILAATSTLDVEMRRGSDTGRVAASAHAEGSTLGLQGEEENDRDLIRLASSSSLVEQGRVAPEEQPTGVEGSRVEGNSPGLLAEEEDEQDTRLSVLPPSLHEEVEDELQARLGADDDNTRLQGEEQECSESGVSFLSPGQVENAMEENCLEDNDNAPDLQTEEEESMSSLFTTSSSSHGQIEDKSEDQSGPEDSCESGTRREENICLNTTPLAPSSFSSSSLHGQIKDMLERRFRGEEPWTKYYATSRGEVEERPAPQGANPPDVHSGRRYLSPPKRPLPLLPTPSYPPPPTVPAYASRPTPTYPTLPPRPVVSQSPSVSRPPPVSSLPFISPPFPPRPSLLSPSAISDAPVVLLSARPDDGVRSRSPAQYRPNESDIVPRTPGQSPLPSPNALIRNPIRPEQRAQIDVDPGSPTEEEAPPSYFATILRDVPPPPPLPALPASNPPREILVAGSRVIPSAEALPTPHNPKATSSSSAPTSFGASSSQYECPLCFECGRDLSNIPCGHVFCTSCILDLLKTDPRCPLCRSPAGEADTRKVFLT